MTSVFQLFFFFLLITLRRKHQICVWLGKWELGGFQLQCDCSPSAVPPYWRGYDGVRAGAAGQCSGTAETASSRGRSWNTTPRLLTLLLSVSHIFSPLLLTLPLFYLRFWSFLTLHHHHLASIHPTPPHSLWSRLPLNSSHTSPPLPVERCRGVMASFEYLNVYQPPPRWGMESFYGRTAVVVLWDHLRRTHWASHELKWGKSVER